MPAPSTTEYLHASEAIYHPDHPEMVPQAGLRPFRDGGGNPMTRSDRGMIAAAYLDKNNNVIVAYQGSNGSKPLLGSSIEQFSADQHIMGGVQPAEFSKADRFAGSVISEARRQGIDQSRIFTTGHSLGGAEAAYVAQKNGLGGETFGAPGLPNYGGGKGLGTPSFTNHVAYGDPVGNFASDTLERTLTNGAAFHYGTVNMVGRQTDENNLATYVGVATGYKNERDRLSSMLPNSPIGALEHPVTAIRRNDAEAHLVTAEGLALQDNVHHHMLDTSYAPALHVTPLRNPDAPRTQSEVSPSPQDLWRAQAAAGRVIAQSAQTPATVADVWARVRAAAPAAQPLPEAASFQGPGHLQPAEPRLATADHWASTRAAAPAAQPQVASVAATLRAGETPPGAETSLPAPPRRSGIRLG